MQKKSYTTGYRRHDAQGRLFDLAGINFVELLDVIWDTEYEDIILDLILSEDENNLDLALIMLDKLNKDE